MPCVYHRYKESVCPFFISMVCMRAYSGMCTPYTVRRMTEYGTRVVRHIGRVIVYCVYSQRQGGSTGVVDKGVVRGW